MRGLRDSADGEGEGGGAIVAMVLGADRLEIGEGGLHAALEFGVDAGFVPVKILEVLDPFEIADGDAAGVGVDVGQDLNAAFGEDGVGVGIGGVVGAFEHVLGTDAGGVFFGDDATESGGDEDVAGGGEELIGGHGLGLGEAGDLAMLSGVEVEGEDVDTGGILKGSEGVGDGDDAASRGGDHLGDPTADVTEALDGDGLAGNGLAFGGEPFGKGDEEAAAGGGVPAERATQLERLAGDDAGLPAIELGVFIDDPAHDLGVGAHVGRGHIDVGADHVVDLFDKLASERLQFALGDGGGVDVDAAFGAAVGEIDDGGLPGHEGGEGVDFIGLDRGMVAEAALHGSAGVVVLDAEAGVGFLRAVLFPEREFDLDLAVGRDQLAASAVVELEQVGGAMEVVVGGLTRGHYR